MFSFGSSVSTNYTQTVYVKTDGVNLDAHRRWIASWSAKHVEFLSIIVAFICLFKGNQLSYCPYSTIREWNLVWFLWPCVSCSFLEDLVSQIIEILINDASICHTNPLLAISRFSINSTYRYPFSVACSRSIYHWYVFIISWYLECSLLFVETASDLPVL